MISYEILIYISYILPAFRWQPRKLHQNHASSNRADRVDGGQSAREGATVAAPALFHRQGRGRTRDPATKSNIRGQVSDAAWRKIRRFIR